ncbi:hypothetical protein [Cryobacterium sp. TMT2-10]|nr:hypothetical protein [Cryobacterium sp. TMT2-10]
MDLLAFTSLIGSIPAVNHRCGFSVGGVGFDQGKLAWPFKCPALRWHI